MSLTTAIQEHVLSIVFCCRTIDLEELGEAFHAMSGLKSEQSELDEMVKQARDITVYCLVENP